MATFGATFIGDLLKDSHRAGNEQEKTVKDIKKVTKELRDIAADLSSKEKWLASDISLLEKHLAQIEEIKKDFSKTNDKDTNYGKLILSEVDGFSTKIKEMLSKISKTGVFNKEEDKKEKKESPRDDELLGEIYDEVTSINLFLQTSLISSVLASRELILTSLMGMWTQTSEYLSFIANHLIKSTYLSEKYNESNKLIQKSIVETTSGIKAENTAKWTESFSFFKHMDKKMASTADMFKNFTKKMFPILDDICSSIYMVWVDLATMATTFFFTVLPVILMIAAVIILAFILLYYVWKYFGNTISKIWDWFKTDGVKIVKFVMGLLWDVAVWIWDALVAAVAFIYDNWDIIGPAIAAMAVAWIAYKIFQAGVWVVQFAWNKAQSAWHALKWVYQTGKWVAQFLWNTAQAAWNAAKWTFDAGMWLAQKAWQAGGFIMNLVKGIVPFMGAVFAWIAGPGLAWLITILSAIPVIGWIVLAIGTIVAFVWFFRKEIWAFLEPIFTWIWDVLKTAWSIYAGIFDSIWSWISTFWSTLWGGLKETVGGVLKNIGSALNPFNWFAKGGEVSKPTAGIIGEAGPEAIIPLSGGASSKLSGALIEFFDHYLPFLKPTVDFIWNVFKPALPLLQNIIDSLYEGINFVIDFMKMALQTFMDGVKFVLDAVYGVVYGIISGLSNLPGWLGGGIFKDLLGKLNKPGISASGKPSEQPAMKSVYAKLLGMDGKTMTEAMFAVVGPSQAEVRTLPDNEDATKYMSNILAGALEKFSWKLSMVGQQISEIKSQGDSIGKFSDGVKPSDTNFKEIKSGILGLSQQIDKAVGSLAGTIAANKDTNYNDPTYELTKMLSRGQTGGKI